MTAIAEGIGFRARGIASATLATANLTRARVFYLARLGFPLLHEGAAFTFRAGMSDITIRLEANESTAAVGPGPSNDAWSAFLSGALVSTICAPSPTR